MNYEKNCNHCHDHDDVRPPQHPFVRPSCDSYGHGSCGRPPSPPPPPPPFHHHPPCDCPPPNRYPSSGCMMGNAFMLNNCVPYLVDNSLIQYGNFLSYSENVITRVTQRRDPSCINLSAIFDMTDSMNTNAMWCHFLEQTIINQYETLGGVLPIVKPGIVFKLYYDIRDTDGFVVHESHVKVISNDTRVHFTDIRDRFVTSNKDVIIANIPKMNYRGIYTMTLNRIEAYVGVIDTLSHIKNGMNQYYQFTDNNLKIAVQHDVIDKQVPDNSILIASCDILKSFEFTANVTTRLRLSFTAFMSNIIVPPNTYGIWSALNDSRNAIIRDLMQEIHGMKESIETLITENIQLKEDLDQLTNRTDNMSDCVDQCIDNIDKITTDITDIKDRVDALESSSGGVTPIDSYTKSEIDVMFNNKVDKVDGMGLSSNDYTDEEKALVHSMQTSQQVVFGSVIEFPTIGDTSKLYIDKQSHLSYIWDDTTKTYVNLNKNNVDIDTIQSIISDIETKS